MRLLDRLSDHGGHRLADFEHGRAVDFSLAVSAFGLVPVLAFLWSAAVEVRALIGSAGVELTFRLLGFHKSWRAEPGEVLEAGISVIAQA